MRNDVLCTLKAAKAGLGLPPSSTAEDARICLLIEAATDVIERACGRKFVRRNYNDGNLAATPTYHASTLVPDEDRYVFDGCGQSKIILPNYPIVNDDNFMFEFLATRDSSGDTWDTFTKNVDYVLDTKLGIITMTGGGKLQYGERCYRIQYEGGYLLYDKAPWVPADLQELCVQMVREGMQDSARVTSEKIGEWSRSYDVNHENPFLEAAKTKYTSDANFL